MQLLYYDLYIDQKDKQSLWFNNYYYDYYYNNHN